MATLCLCELTGRKFHPVAIEGLSSKFRTKSLNLARQREKAVFKIPFDQQKFDKDDIDFLYNSIWRKRGSLHLQNMGAGAKYVLTRWNPTRPASVGNMVLIQKWVADKLLEMFPDRAPDRAFVLYVVVFESGYLYATHSYTLLNRYKDKKTEETMKDSKNVKYKVTVSMDAIKRINASLAGAVSY